MIHSYPWYITDWRESGEVLAMTPEERDVYRNLLDMCWRDGSLPTNERALQAMSLNREKEFKRAWPSVRRMFVERDGRLWNSKVDEKRPALIKSKDDRKLGADIANAKRRAKRIAERDAERPLNGHGANGSVSVQRTPPPSPSPSPEETNTVSSPDSLFAAILKRHPKKAAPVYAESEFARIIGESQDPISTAVLINAAHDRWCRYWLEIGTQVQFVPKLMDWLRGGDWTQEPPSNGEPEPPRDVL